jgi:hypothetical protein
MNSPTDHAFLGGGHDDWRVLPALIDGQQFGRLLGRIDRAAIRNGVLAAACGLGCDCLPVDVDSCAGFRPSFGAWSGGVHGRRRASLGCVFGLVEIVMDSSSQNSQRVYARVAGISLLVIISSSLLSNDLIVPGDAAVTASNILAHERQFRIGLAGELIMLNFDFLLAIALYAVLKPVNRNLALLGALWRIGNAIVLGVGVAATLVALRDLGDVHYLLAFKADQIQAIARQLLDIHGAATIIGLIFFGLGAAMHSYLFWKSRYIPRVLSASYLAVTVLIVVCCFAIIVFPGIDATIDPWFVVPDFVVELLVALWLTIKGVHIIDSGRESLKLS